MKKGIIAAVLLVFASISACFGQLFERGQILVDGSLGGYYSKNSASVVSSFSAATPEFGFNLGGSTAYFLNQKDAFGLSLDYELDRTNSGFISNGTFTPATNLRSKVGFGFFWDQYHQIASEGFFWTTRVGLSPNVQSNRFKSTTFNSKVNQFGTSVWIQPGIGYLINGRFGLRLNMGWAGFVYNGTTSALSSASQTDNFQFVLNASLRSAGIGGFFILKGKNDSK